MQCVELEIDGDPKALEDERRRVQQAAAQFQRRSKRKRMCVYVRQSELSLLL